MSNEMVLDHAILGLLQRRPLTGYELKKAFDSSIRHFWTADQSLIYRVLRRLAGEGYVTFEAVPQEGKPNRKVYTITSEGEEELKRWLGSEDSREAPARDRYLVHLFFSGLLTDEAVLDIMRGDLERSNAFLAEYEELSDRILEAAGANASRMRFFAYLTLDHALWMRRAFNAWLSSVIERVEQGEPDRKDWSDRFPTG